MRCSFFSLLRITTLRSIQVHQQQGKYFQSYHICRANHLKLSKAAHVMVSVVWDPVETWRSDEHYAALGTAWLLFPALQQMKNPHQHSHLFV